MTTIISDETIGYIGYEYRETVVPKEYISLCLDSYPCFGWEPDPNHKPAKEGDSGANLSTKEETLYFRRNRNISNKAELTRLQRHFDSCIAELRALEQAKTTPAIIAALAVGMIGTAFMAGSTFAVTAETPNYGLMVLLAVPGFLGWIIPIFLYRNLLKKRTAEIEPLIGQKYDENYSVCEKASRLLR